MFQAEAPARERRLEGWVRQYGDQVLRLCFVYLSDRTQAEDAMQDTFLKAWHAMDSFENRHAGSEKAWLMRIAINVCRDYQRSRWFRHVDLSRALEDLPPRLQMVMPEDRDMMLDILRLPAKYKQVLLLYYYQHMTVREVAEVLSISASTVSHRLKKAEGLLKTTLIGGEEG